MNRKTGIFLIGIPWWDLNICSVFCCSIIAKLVSLQHICVFVCIVHTFVTLYYVFLLLVVNVKLLILYASEIKCCLTSLH